MQPTVEVLLAAYNGERFLREQLDSLLVQTWKSWHATVSDDGSTDGTAAILDEYAASWPDRIARYAAGQRFGNARDHFFHLMQRCDAPYMLFCDQDDVWLPDKVERTMRALLEAERDSGADAPVLVFTDVTPVNEQLSPIAPSLMQMQRQDASRIDYRALLFQNIVTGCATGINRALAQLAGRCVDVQEIIMHDWWLGVVAARFGKAVYLDESTLLYRQHGGNSVGAKAVGSAGYVVANMTGLRRVQAAIMRKKRQARVFAQTYGQALTDEDRAFLTQFAQPKSGLRFYWQNRKLVRGFGFLAGMMALG